MRANGGDQILIWNNVVQAQSATKESRSAKLKGQAVDTFETEGQATGDMVQ